MANKIKVTIECYQKTKGWNWRLLEYSNLGVECITSTRQNYSKKSECIHIASRIDSYAGVKPEIIVLKKYYIIKKRKS